MHIKWRIADEDRFEHVKRGVPGLRCCFSVQTCLALKAGECVYAVRAFYKTLQVYFYLVMDLPERKA